MPRYEICHTRWLLVPWILHSIADTSCQTMMSMKILQIFVLKYISCFLIFFFVFTSWLLYIATSHYSFKAPLSHSLICCSFKILHATCSFWDKRFFFFSFFISLHRLQVDFLNPLRCCIMREERRILGTASSVQSISCCSRLGNPAVAAKLTTSLSRDYWTTESSLCDL